MKLLNSRSASRTIATIAFVVGLATILGALGFQYIGGYQPCELCYQQRWPYYVGLPLLLLVLVLWTMIPRAVLALGILLVTLIFAWSTYLGGFHAGVEWGFWQGPTACSGTGAAELSFEALSDINSTRVVPCDKPQWRFLGLSFAGYNAIISVVMTASLVWALIGLLRRPGHGGRR